MNRTEQILQHIFEQMCPDTKSINVLMTDSPFSTKKNKQDIAELMFEKFKVKSFALMNTAVLSLFSTGKTTGLVAEVGDGVSYTVPVFEGYAMPHAMHYIPVAGRDVTDLLLQELMQAGEPVQLRHRQFVNDMKEQMCCVAQDFRAELASYEDDLSFEERQYELPDNVVIEVNRKKRIRAAEVLFDPSLRIEPISSSPTYDEFSKLPEDHHLRGGIARMAFASIQQCDTDLKVSLYNNIVLAGGSTMMRGFHDRFDSEMRELVYSAQDDQKSDFFVSAELNRKYAAWVGGSMISSFSTFRDMAVDNASYHGQTENDKKNLILKKDFT